MNDALQKFLHFSRAYFWDRQFYVFLIISILFAAVCVYSRKKDLKHDKLLEQTAKFFGRSEPANYVLIAVVNLLICLTILFAAGVPVAQTHDEFAYLLAADTFLHGRITNQTPVSPAHFEYFHILIKPVYAAKYPPLQGVFLAAGTLIAGYPMVGVWLSSIVSSLAVYWLLRAFFSPVWAVYGSFLWIFSPLSIVWCDSYWGGHAAVIGGAVSIGAFFRYLKTVRLKYLFVWGIGIFLLLNSRLYEGTILTVILCLIWLFEMLKNKKIERITIPAALVFGLIVALNLLFVGFYNYSVTGDPMLLPYRMHHSQYHRTPLFIFQDFDEPKSEGPPIVRNLDERWAADFTNRYQTWTAATVATILRIPAYLFWLTRSPFLIALFLAGLLFSLGKAVDRRLKKAPLILGLFLIGLFLTTFSGDRFAAAIVGMFIAVATLGARTISQRANFLRPLIFAVPLIVGGGFLYGMSSIQFNGPPKEINPENLGSRAEIERFLKSQGGKHLLFLETEKAFPADARFYVYNEADPDASTIIWAHDLGPEKNALLIDRFKDRRVWRLKNIDHRAALQEYENPADGRRHENIEKEK